MDGRFLILYSGLLTVLSPILIPLLSPSKKSRVALLFVLLNAVTTSIVSIHVLATRAIEFSIAGGLVFGDILLRIDPLSAWFILLVNITCITGAWYGIHYMKAYSAQRSNLSLHWTSFVIFHASLILVCSIQHGLAFLVVWEIMSVSSFLLMMFDYSRFKTLNAGITYMVQMHIAIVFLTIAFIWASVAGGSFGFESIGSFNQADSPRLFLLFFIGFGIKAGFIPLHTWLPHAHPAAPSHISGIMSGIMVKMGIYGILRMSAYLTSDLVIIGAGILVLSVLTAFYGILSGAIHRDYKRVLAFSTIENMGIVGMGIGIGLIGKGTGNQILLVIGFSAALLHLLNHSLYKSLLFFTAGNLYQLTHTRNMEHLGGLIKKMPSTTFFFLCGAIAICGLPPFNGFVSKLLLFSGLIEGIRATGFKFNILMISAIVGLALVSGIALLTFGKAFSVIFLGNPRDKTIHPKPEYLSYRHLPFFLILFLMLLIGIFPSLILTTIEKIAQGFSNTLPENEIIPSLVPMVSEVGIASLIVILLAASIYYVRSRIVSGRTVNISPTWGGGYIARGEKFQYTGKSFSKTLAKLFAFITGEEKKYTEIEPRTVFPANRSYQSNYAEFFEKNILNRISNQLFSFMNYFSFVHNGRVQFYILYGFLFMLILILATFSNIL
ncbi:MAG: proton-conducting transporter membrane subunit [Cyclobacteriaceae bacterium]